MVLTWISSCMCVLYIFFLFVTLLLLLRIICVLSFSCIGFYFLFYFSSPHYDNICICVVFSFERLLCIILQVPFLFQI